MSHKPTPYSPNFPQSQGYVPPEESKMPESYPKNPHAGYPGPTHPMPMPVSAPLLPPGAQPLPGMQHGFQPGAYQPGYQPGFAPGFPPPHQGYLTPVMQQPVPSGWMNIPQGLSNCPPGLEYLSLIDEILIHQKVEVLESFVGFETNNKYTIKNNLGQKVYYAVEENDCCTRNCCGPIRPFDLKVMDNYQKEVIHMHRPLACDSCFCPCWLQSIEVTAPPGTLIGSIEQQWSILKPSYAVKDATGQVVLQIKGPIFTCSMCGDVDFKVYSKDGQNKVGKITKQWSGLAREVFTDSDYFGISFPMDLDVRIKAVLLGAAFLIDFMFFEKGERSQGASALLNPTVAAITNSDSDPNPSVRATALTTVNDDSTSSCGSQHVEAVSKAKVFTIEDTSSHNSVVSCSDSCGCDCFD